MRDVKPAGKIFRETGERFFTLAIPFPANVIVGTP
jgi:hypothetical protein